MLQSTRPILLIEDDEVDVMTVQRAFKQLQIKNRLDVTSNGEDALEMLKHPQEHLPCLIFLDLNMPKMGGLEFLGLIKQEKNLRRIPIVILTTSNNEQDKIKSFELGAAGYMLKPIGYEQFIDLIRTIVQYWTVSEIP